MVEVMKIMVTSFKRSHACTATLSAPNPAVGNHWPTPPLETPGQQRHYFANKGPSSQGYGFYSSHVWMCTSCEELTHWKMPWCGVRLNVGGEEGCRGWNSWIASLTQWTWTWANSGRWWWTGRPGVLPFMGSQRVRHDWANELNWTELNCSVGEDSWESLELQGDPTSLF